MGTTVVNTNGATGTFYHGKQGADEVSGILIGSESIYLDEVFRTDIATSEEDMKAASDSLDAAGNVGAVSDGQ
jgi:exo-beta-1,3-glucanase (GH17 family)